MAQLNGRVFSRLQQYDALPADFKREVEALEQFLTASQGDIFGAHRTLQLQSVYGVRTRALLEKIEAWVKQHGHEFQGQAPATDQTPTAVYTDPTAGAHIPRAKQLLDALVLKGFVTPHKEDKPEDVPSATEDLEFKNNELLVARAKNVAATKDAGPTVWDLVDGAVFAGMVQRKTGLLESITHGSDAYAVVNMRLRNLTLFTSDLGREPIVELDAHTMRVSFDKSQYENGVKVWNDTDEELLSAASQLESDALVQALLAVGASHRDGLGHGHAAATAAEKLRHEVKKAVDAENLETHVSHGRTKQPHEGWDATNKTTDGSWTNQTAPANTSVSVQGQQHLMPAHLSGQTTNTSTVAP